MTESKQREIEEAKENSVRRKEVGEEEKEDINKRDRVPGNTD